MGAAPRRLRLPARSPARHAIAPFHGQPPVQPGNAKLIHAKLGLGGFQLFPGHVFTALE
jgi:hypothetical protein